MTPRSRLQSCSTGRRLRSIAASALAICLLFLAPAEAKPQDLAGSGPPLYVRRWTTVGDVVAGVHRAMAAEGIDAALWLFGRGFPADAGPALRRRNPRRLDSDLPDWLDAIARDRRPEVPTKVAGLGGRGLVDMGAPDWRTRALAMMTSVSPGTVHDAAQAVTSGLAGAPGRAKAVVFVLDGHEAATTERGSGEQALTGGGRPWWSPAAVALAVRNAGAKLWVVAPEARFGESGETDRVPFLPWTARPDTVVQTTAPSDLDRIADEMVERARREAEARGEEFTELPDGETFGDWTRFGYSVSCWRQVVEGTCVRGTDVPSGFGEWRYAAAAAQCGGTYVFYPSTGRHKFFDVCAFNPERRRVVEEQRRPGSTARADAKAARWLAAAAERLEKVTPWVRSRRRSSTAGGWSVSLATATDWLEVRDRDLPMPFVDLPTHSTHAIRQRVIEQMRRALDVYDTVSADCARAIDAEMPAAGRVARWSPDVADLHVFRAQVEASSFHLAAVLDALQITPESERPTDGLAWVATVKISELVRTESLPELDNAEERSFAVFVEPLLRRRYPGSPVNPPADQPSYRAPRSLDRIGLRFDAILRDRLERVRSASQAAVDYNRDTPWDWIVRYSGLHTFIFLSTPRGAGVITEPDLRKLDEGPPTSTDPPPPPTPR